MTAASPAPSSEALELLTLDELTERVEMSVRNVRFYTSKGLVPPPLRQGRSGYYTDHHVARLELVRALQDHGFTLSAIKGYLDRIPSDATPADMALHLSLLAPVTGERDVDVAQGLAGLGVDAEAAAAVAEVYARHGQEVFDELSEIVRAHVWPAVRDAGGSVEDLHHLVHRLKPLTIAGLVTAYERAMDESTDSYRQPRTTLPPPD